jgi:hypothetical protein
MVVSGWSSIVNCSPMSVLFLWLGVDVRYAVCF